MTREEERSLSLFSEDITYKGKLLDYIDVLQCNSL